MTLSGGEYVLGPGDGELLVHTKREGAAARVGHDVTLRATRWSATVRVDAESVAGSHLSAEVDAASLVVVEATGGAIPITDSQRSEVERNTREKVLQAGTHPTVTFESTAVSGNADRATVTGTMTLRGRSRPVTFEVRVEDGAIRASATLVQTEFGVKPYSAMLGTLRVKDLVDISADVRLPGGA